MFTTTTKINLPKILIEILNNLQDLGITPILVGGCVRDYFLKLPIKDYDIEIFNATSFEQVEKTLKKFGKVNLVGKSFGILKLNIDALDNLEFDFSFPRVEQKIGNFHKDFEVTTNGNLTFKEAARRRDFTINAIGYDFFKNEFLDPFGGIDDLKNKIIRHVDDKTFCEDSLRVYRAVQFACRFEFGIDKKTQDLCKKIVFEDDLQFLSKERIFEEFKKLFLKSNKPSIGFKLTKEFGILGKYFSELETNDFENRLKNIDTLAKILKDKNIGDFRKLYLCYTCLCSGLDENKVLTFLEKITCDKRFIKNILLLSQNSLPNTKKDLKRISLKLKIEDLIFLNLAENQASKEILEILEMAKNLDILDKPIKAIIKGEDLIKLGFIPSVLFKEILDFAFDLQVDFELNKEKIIEKIINKYRF